MNRSLSELLIDCRIKLKGSIVIISKIKTPNAKTIVIKLLLEAALKSINKEIDK